uniref:Uncharacterized protein n=1 Tax=Amphimedon queenslandica TaxID=400682 RepID=A0A1X7SSS5_AMPQE
MLPDATKLHAQYAKAAESDCQYKAAAAAYERAMNYQNATRFFQKINDYALALQFLVLSKCNDEAFNMAE